jgi:hypothetical protein
VEGSPTSQSPGNQALLLALQGVTELAALWHDIQLPRYILLVANPVINLHANSNRALHCNGGNNFQDSFPFPFEESSSSSS